MDAHSATNELGSAILVSAADCRHRLCVSLCNPPAPFSSHRQLQQQNSAASASMAAAEAETQVLVRFTTQLPPELQVPETEVAVPASLKRYGLSQIINHLLALDPARPFDFIIDGELLRKSLQQHLLDHGISPELLVVVEYVPAVVPPEPRRAMPQDDWVTGVAALGSSLASASADGVVRLWNGAGDCWLEVSAHKMGVNALAAVPQQQQQEQAILLSTGKDHAMRLWQLAADSAQQASSSGASCAVLYQGHTDAVQAVAASPAGNMCCSGGWDGQLLLWHTGQQVLEEASAAAEAGEEAGSNRKKRRVGAANGTAAAAPAAPLTLSPASALAGHVHCVSALAWPDARTLFSSGWDHSVRRWDSEVGANTDTYNGSKAVYAVAAPAGGGSVVAFAGSDRVLRIWDSRAVGEALAVKSVNAHAGWVSCLAWRPGSGHHLASGGHDGAVKLWDIRSAVPLGSLSSHGEGAKVLAVGWWGPARLASGGSDSKLQLYELP